MNNSINVELSELEVKVLKLHLGELLDNFFYIDNSTFESGPGCSEQESDILRNIYQKLMKANHE